MVGSHISLSLHALLAAYKEGDTVAILPGEDPAAASPHADIVICTGLGSYRNGIVGRSDAVIAVGGGAGTLQVKVNLSELLQNRVLAFASGTPHNQRCQKRHRVCLTPCHSLRFDSHGEATWQGKEQQTQKAQPNGRCARPACRYCL